MPALAAAGVALVISGPAGIAPETRQRLFLEPVSSEAMPIQPGCWSSRHLN
jgi:hypothetical protein